MNNVGTPTDRQFYTPEKHFADLDADVVASVVGAGFGLALGVLLLSVPWFRPLVRL